MLTISMSPGINMWCMIILMSECSTCQYVGFHKETYKFQSTAGHTESMNKFHHGSSRERERIIMYGKYIAAFTCLFGALLIYEAVTYAHVCGA